MEGGEGRGGGGRVRGSGLFSPCINPYPLLVVGGGGAELDDIELSCASIAVLELPFS